MTIALQIIFFLLINAFVVFYFDNFSKYFNLYDYPTLARKKQKIPISLFGGFIFFINFIVFIIFDIYFNNNFFLMQLGLNTNIKFLYLLLFIVSFI